MASSKEGGRKDGNTHDQRQNRLRARGNQHSGRARAANIDIPTLCYLKDLNEIGACRICMVEVEGQETLVAACDNEVHAGMVIHTNSQKVRMTRRVNLQLLLSQHEVNCVKCTRSGNCKLQKLANDYNLLGAPYQKSCARRRRLLRAHFAL